MSSLVSPTHLLFVLAAAAYLVATALFCVFLFRANADEQGTRSRKLAPQVLAFGAVVHAAQIVVASEVLHVCPVQGVHFAMNVLSVLMVLAYLLLTRWRMDVVGAFVAPLALASLLASHLYKLPATPSRRPCSAPRSCRSTSC